MTSRFFVIDGDRSRCADIGAALRRHSRAPTVTVYGHFIEACGALLRAAGHELPDALVVLQPCDAWLLGQLRECFSARRELYAVPIVALDLRAPLHTRTGAPALAVVPVPDPHSSVPDIADWIVRRFGRQLPEPAMRA